MSEEAKTEQTPSNNDNGNIAQADDPIKLANDAAKRLEEANRVQAENIKRMEQLEQRRILSGQTEAGQVKKELTPEEKVIQGTKNYFKGSVIEKYLS